VRIRNVATVGGGIAHADPAQDPPPGLIALNASVKLVSKNGERILPITDVFQDYYETAIQPGELLSEVIIPPLPASAKTAYLKFLPRTADDYATVAVAARGEVQDGIVRNLRVALAAAASTPVHATAVEQALEGQPATPENIRRAAQAVADQVDPLDDFRGSPDYKRDMAVVFTRRALERILL
jgi:carbon-monoxide dehydrogenase medium subunit